MYDQEPTNYVFWVLLGIFGASVVGFIWIRRIARGDPDPESFRSTASAVRDYLPIVGIAAVVVLLATVFFIANR